MASSGENRPAKRSRVTPDHQWKFFLALNQENTLPPHSEKALHTAPIRVAARDKLVVDHQDRDYAIHISPVQWIIHSVAFVPQDCPFRLYACFQIDDSDNAVVQYYELWLNEDMFVRAMSSAGTFPREIAITKLIRSVMTSDCVGGSHYHGSTIPVEEKLETFMTATETDIAQRRNTFDADLSCIHVGHTQWVYNRSRDVFVPETVQHRMTPLHYRGGILAGRSTTSMAEAVLRVVAGDTPRELSRTADMVDGNTYLATRATLVVLPQDMPHYWSKYLDAYPQLKIVRLLSAHDAENVTLQDAVEADVVITTYQHLRSKRECARMENFCRFSLSDYHSPAYIMIQPSTLRVATRPLVHTLQDHLTDAVPPLACFYWKRLVYADVEQLFVSASQKQRVVRPLLVSFAAQYVWGLSYQLNVGPQGYFSQYCHILNCEASYWSPSLMERVLQRCFRQLPNTTAPRQHQQIIHWINLSPQERAMYDTHRASNKSAAAQVQVCTYHNYERLGNQGNTIRMYSLENVLTTICSDKQARLEQAEDALQELEGAINGASNDHARARIRRKSYIWMANLEWARRSLEYFDRVAADLRRERPVAKCPICFEHDTDTLTACGHLFCRPCLSHQLAENEKCPLCNGELVADDAFQIKELATNVHGSKFDVLAKTLAAMKRTVVFSQFLPLLRVLKTILTEQNVSSSLVAGNTRTRHNALKQYENQTVPIVLIHLESRGSATRVSQADHIVFIHSLVGTECQKLYNTATTITDETPAIHWFLAADTIEKPLVSGQQDLPRGAFLSLQTCSADTPQ